MLNHMSNEFENVSFGRLYGYEGDIDAIDASEDELIAEILLWQINRTLRAKWRGRVWLAVVDECIVGYEFSTDDYHEMEKHEEIKKDIADEVALFRQYHS